MQLDSSRVRATPSDDGIATTFSDWAQAHRAYGGDFDEDALHAGIQATVAAYRRGLATTDAFETGRRAFYSALG